MTRVVITGAKGRMGQALIQCATRFDALQITGKIDVGDDIQSVIDNCDCVIDFSFHNATPAIAELCAARKKALVIGTTGHSDSEAAQIREATKKVPTVWASNYSTGVNALFWLTRKAAEIMGPDFDLEIVEMHHRLKKDAPSGTAATLSEILAEVRNLQTKEALRHGRHGIVGERTKNEIGMHSLRGGDVVGDHTVIFSNVGERLELTHKASSRDTFANGALRAALWVIKQPSGLYTMQDVLGLR
jgi:4-hydroxy-tetrahydrodipicolinate reductase